MFAPIEGACFRAFIKNDKRLPIHQITLADLETAKDIYQTQQLFYVNVKIESYKTIGPSQCFTCQDFGHSSLRCGHPPRCVKCGSDHASNTCTKPKEVTPTCCNCGGEHTANYRGCPYLAKLKLEKTNSKTFTNQQSQKSFNFPPLSSTQEKPQLQTGTDKNISYAKATKAIITTTNTQPTISSFHKTIQIIQKLLKSAQNCSDSSTKDEIINTIMSIIQELSDTQNE